MSTSLRVAIQSVLGLAGFGALVFLPAWTFDYWQAWVFLAVFTVVSFFPTVYLLRKDPAIVERRMRAGPKAETRPMQKVVVAGIMILFMALLVFSALDHRFGWVAGAPRRIPDR